ncbi:post-GPI attachment to proteins factor 6 isoform X2 [Oratosquilla oratoria]|uniref:post-GPI attachment to proteins factor 6 isoform X2 n=1 Tax=Oratosquilla oratoria TaxID=337810 RepID=UPI003F76B0F2
MELQVVIYLVITLVLGCQCLVPEVSQEGLLQPYTTYADVTLFHYYVPEEVTRVTWEFAAFMDAPSCPKREVHVLVQHGSYPVISSDNVTFPKYMYIKRSSLHQVTIRSEYQPHDATILPLYNPLPGSWFAAAYIPNWNEQMQQEGIVHKCRYSLGSIAMWSQKERVRTLNIGAPQHIRTTENFAYYRFYVPSFTWFLKVNISDCQVREERINPETGELLFRWCMKGVSLRARALPPYDVYDDVASNISRGGGHVMTVTHPYADGYYYLLVSTEGETDVKVTITTKECGGTLKHLHGQNIREAVSRVSSSLVNYSSSSATSSPSHNITSTQEPTLPSLSNLLGSSSLLTEEEDGEERETEEDYEERLSPDIHNLCYPLLPLARIKHARDFTDTFLIQGGEWYSTWLSLRSNTPIYTHMALLPFTDIGGTLNINIRMDELFLNTTSQLIAVVGCVSKGRPPLIVDGQIQCEEQLLLNVTSRPSSSRGLLLIPFPEPDTWFLSLMAQCYYKGQLSPCLQSQVMVSVDVRTQPCVYEGEHPCGEHGLCQETHRGQFFFTSCVCTEGYRGWGCQDATLAKGWENVMTGVCLLTLSNVFFLPPAVLAARRKLYTESLLYTATMAASTVYHACDNEVLSYCLTKYEVLQFTDFFFSLLCFWVTVVGLGGLSEQWSSLLHTLGVVIIAPAVEYSRTALASFMVPMAIAASIPDRVHLARLRCGHHPALLSYQKRLDDRVVNSCPGCNTSPHTIQRIMEDCIIHNHARKQHNIHSIKDLWENPVSAVAFLGETGLLGQTV